MVLKPHQVPFLAREIVLALLHSKLVTFPKGMDAAEREIEAILQEDMEWEREIEERARELLEEKEQEEGLAFYSVDYRELFKMIKRRLAEEEGFPIRPAERWGEVSQFIVEELWDKELIDYDVHDGRIIKIIFDTITSFFNRDREIREEVKRKLENYKRKLVEGSDEYELVFQQLYQQELRRRGLL
ncbi:MAG: DUF507 family protein [Campylobacterales bacterium]